MATTIKGGYIVIDLENKPLKMNFESAVTIKGIYKKLLDSKSKQIQLLNSYVVGDNEFKNDVIIPDVVNYNDDVIFLHCSIINYDEEITFKGNFIISVDDGVFFAVE